jgi:hypothetical protein
MGFQPANVGKRRPERVDPQQTAQRWLDTFPGVTPPMIANYLFDLLTAPVQGPAYSSTAVKWFEAFCESMPQADRKAWVLDVLKANATRTLESFVLARNWADAFLATHAHEADPIDSRTNGRAVRVLERAVHGYP